MPEFWPPIGPEMSDVQPFPSAPGGHYPIRCFSVLDYKDFCLFCWDDMLYQKPTFVGVRCFLRRLVLEKNKGLPWGQGSGETRFSSLNIQSVLVLSLLGVGLSF